MKGRYRFLAVLALMPIGCASLGSDPTTTSWERWEYRALLETESSEPRSPEGTIEILHTHGTNFMGKLLGHAVLKMDAQALDSVLSLQEEMNSDFASGKESDSWVEHAFGPESIGTMDQEGNPQHLDWWNPSDEQSKKYVRWFHHYRDRPRTWVYLQINESDSNMNRVYLRLESD